MSENIPASEVLYRAADLIEKRGWGQGSKCYSTLHSQGHINDTGPLCLEGGIQAALGMTVIPEEQCPAYAAVHGYLEGHSYWSKPVVTMYGFDRLYNWNDDAERTAAEVIEVLRACAVIEAAKENADVRESVTVR